MNLETIVFENNTLRIIDQTKLPEEFRYLALNTLDEVIDAIKGLKVRGAPAIGVTAALGLLVHAQNLSKTRSLNKTVFLQDCISLKSARPTAVNLSWAVEQMVQVFLKYISAPETELLQALKQRAEQIHESDRMTCAQIGKYGAELLPETANILTHCNAGILATGGMGTALSVVYTAAKTKSVHVFVDETRPVGQGARLTYWELEQNHIPATLITDNMAALLMYQNKIDAVIVGADRIALNGDVANKIGTYGLAVLAHHHQIPFYVAAPVSSFDFTIQTGDDIPIEVRKREEVLNFWNITSEQYKVYNPAFDITPNQLISAIITETGVIQKPLKENIIKLQTY